MESLRLSDEEDYEYEILSILNIAHAWTSVILVGKRNSRLILLQVSQRVSTWRGQFSNPENNSPQLVRSPPFTLPWNIIGIG